MSMAAQQGNFAARLDRIHSGKTSCWTVPGAGIAEPGQEGRISAMNRQAKVKQQKKGNGPITLLIALVLGFVLVFVGEWATVTYLTEDGPLGIDPIAMLGYNVGSVVVAVIAAFMIESVMGWKGNARWALTIGFVIAAVFMPEIVQQDPELFAQYYPSDWVSMQLSMGNLLDI